ncbi:MAG: T9SS type A sorting domain-containing protein [Lewinellaceae bacterium]|nr:T9SS type A sorting domain-containing protein [Lewinellaceae bacterium]
MLAFDSYFRNNARSVEYRRYGGQNYGRFVNCAFTIDGGHYGHPFREHVKLNGVRGLQFIGCTFSNDTGTGNVFLGKGAGIHSLDANFTVGGSSTVFQMLRFGVQAGAAKGAEGFMIRDATFRELEKGVLAEAANHFTVTRCTLDVGGHVSNLPPFLVSQEGVQINYSTGFTVMGNRLRGLAASQDETVGVKVIDTGAGTDANTIYGNNFDVFYVGNAAVGDNVGTSLGGGIVYECNFNLGSNVFDFWVQEGEGITEDQRSALGGAAGNTFSQNGGQPEGDFSNQGSFINYFYYDDEGDPNNPPDVGQEPLFYTESTISKLPEDFNDCSNGETGGEIPDEGISLIKNRFFEAKGQYQLYKADYEELIDDGDTPGLLAEVNQVGAGQAAGLINDLLEISPYVSQHVLKAVVDKPAVFNNGMQVDLLEANPEAVRKAGFLLYLEENSSLDEEELSQVQQASLLNTVRDAIEEDLSTAYAGMHRAVNLVLAYYLLDSVAYNRDSALLWLDHKGSLHSHYLKTDILLQSGQDETAEDVLTSIPEAFLLKAKQQAEYDNKLALFQLLFGKADIFKLDSLEIIALSDIAQLEGLAAQQARNLLNYAYGGVWEPDHSLPAAVEERPAVSASTWHQHQASIRAFPNPAKATVTFEFTILAGEKASVRLVNAMGRSVADIPLLSQVGLKEWDVSGLAEGIYWYQLWIDNKPGPVGKLAIQH